jgi:hypothetical protein
VLYAAGCAVLAVRAAKSTTTGHVPEPFYNPSPLRHPRPGGLKTPAHLSGWEASRSSLPNSGYVVNHADRVARPAGPRMGGARRGSGPWPTGTCGRTRVVHWASFPTGAAWSRVPRAFNAVADSVVKATAEMDRPGEYQRGVLPFTPTDGLSSYGTRQTPVSI